MKTTHIVLVQGNSLYDIQRFICGRVREILAQRGFQVTITDRTEYAAEHLFIQQLEEIKPDAIFTMDMTGFECKTLGDEVSYNGIPCRMMHFLPRAPWEYAILNQRYNFTMFFYCGRRIDSDVIRHYYHRIIHADCLPQLPYEEAWKKPYHERETEVYLPCTYEPSAELQQRISQLPKVFVTIADYCIREMEKQPKLSFEQTLSDCLKKLQFENDAESIIEILQELKDVPKYVKMHYIECVTEALTARKIKVSASGHGWKAYEAGNREYFHVMGRDGVSYEKCREIIKNAKIVLHYDESDRIPAAELAAQAEQYLKLRQSGDIDAVTSEYERFQGRRYDLESAMEQVLGAMELTP